MLTTLLLVYWLIGSLIAGSLILATVLCGRLSRETPEVQLDSLNGSVELSGQENGEDVAYETRPRKPEGSAAFAD